MPLRKYRPTSPGLRQMTRSTFDEITADEPHKPLTERLVRKAGRNSQGKLTVRHQGAGQKRLYRVIDWKRDKFGVPATISTLWIWVPSGIRPNGRALPTRASASSPETTTSPTPRPWGSSM